MARPSIWHRGERERVTHSRGDAKHRARDPYPQRLEDHATNARASTHNISAYGPLRSHPGMGGELLAHSLLLRRFELRQPGIDRIQARFDAFDAVAGIGAGFGFAHGDSAADGDLKKVDAEHT
jgi:hypothetical protein